MYEEIRAEEYRQLHLEHRVLRSISDPFSLPDTRFIELFSLNKYMVHYLIVRLTPLMRISNKYNAVTPELQIFAALSFYATGSYQRGIGQSYLLSMSQQTVSRSIKEVTQCIYTHLTGEFIKFPRTNQEKQEIANQFMEKTRFPATIGAIDCTHVDILCPVEEEHNYLDRRGKHSKNVQIVCKYSTRILSINARYAGSTHDAFIWRQSRVNIEMEECYRQGQQFWLLGDSGYPLQPWLMTPILDAVPGSTEDRYTNRHVRARNCIERCNGILKTRFRCILRERKLRYAPDIVGKIITVCAVLHNICIAGGVELPENIIIRNPNHVRIVNDHDILEDGRLVRNNLIRNYFA